MYNPDGQHLSLLENKPSLAFDPSKPYAPQATAIREKVLSLLGEVPGRVPLDPVVESVTEHETYTERRISFAVEKNVRAICLFCIPKKRKEKVPLCICLQGHGTGMHVSLGRALYPSDHPDDGDRDVGLQALERGYAALCLEQRGMGERRSECRGYGDWDKGSPRCRTTSMVALLLGRTLLGERCFDVSRAIDLALTYPEIDGEKILCTGNSGGGTTTYYAALYDERIKVAMPSCSVCSFKKSIGMMLHCECNYVPGLAKYVDMGDMAAAIAPRGLVVISGKEDLSFLREGVLSSCDTIREIYSAAGAPERFVHKEGPEGHRYYKTLAWEGFTQVTNGEWDK